MSILLKKMIVLITALAIALSLSSPAWAIRDEHIKEKVEQRREAINQKRVNQLRRMGETMIDRRIKALEKAIDRVEASNRVDQSDRDAVIADLNANISSLNSLKASIQVNEDIESLRAQVRSIVTDYRIYLVVIPRSRGLLGAGRAEAVMARLNGISVKVGNFINKAKELGYDTAEIEAIFADYKSKLATAQAKIEEALAEFESMKPGEDPATTKDRLEKGKAALREAREILKASRDDLKRIVELFRAMKKANPESTSTP